MPVSSEIRLSDAYMQQSPLSFFESGKKTDAPALAAVLPLKSGQKEYFCIYRQNEKADYNHYMLPALFRKETAGIISE
jgi:chlorite dismutase